jgi:ADYC domain
MASQRTVVVACVMALAACDPLPLTAPTSRVALKSEPPCNDIYCGDNGPDVGAAPFWEVDLSGAEAASTGFRFISASHPASDAGPLWVDRAWPRWGGVKGAALVGLKVQLDSPAGPVELRFERFEALSYLDGTTCRTDAGVLSQTDCIPAYHIVYPVLDAGADASVAGGPSWPLAELCPKSKLADGGLQETLAIVSRGDRFDRDAGTLVVSGEGVGSWVNFSCAGDPIAKLLLIRHASAARRPDAGVSEAQIKAALNMFTARYCGEGGRMHTSLGHKLAFEDFFDWAPHYAGVSTVEALWNEAGAVCVTHPRLGDKEPVECKREPCTSAVVADWRAHGLLLSRNPVVLEVSP